MQTWNDPQPASPSPSPETVPLPESPLRTPTGPRPRQRPEPRPARSLDRLFLNRRGELDWDQMTGFHRGPRRQGSKLILWSFMAVLIDALVLLSMSCFFLLTFVLVMKSSLGFTLGLLPTAGVWGSLFVFFLLGSWIYLISTRILFGFSLGEWACDLRLGQPSERRGATYALKVVWRSTLILLTGLVPLPLLSLLVGRDLPGTLSGVKLISLK